MNIFDEIESMLKAKFPLLYLTTNEYSRVTQKLRAICFKNNIAFHTWDIVDGLKTHKKEANTNRLEKVENHPEHGNTQDIISLFEYIRLGLIEGEKNEEHEIFVLEDCHKHFDEMKMAEHIRKLSLALKMANKHIVFISPFTKLPNEFEKYITVLNMPLPDRDDLRIRLRSIIGKETNINADLEKYIIDSALGLTDTEAELAFRLAQEKVGLNSKDCISIIANEKEQIIKKSGILDYIQVNQSMKDTVGGLENLKQWLIQRSKAFELKAKEFGLPEPKGVILLGVPGCGKSLTAKCIASEWRQPLLKLDIGKVFQAEVGSSENNIRLALQTAEAVAPCVLWIDEIEKGLSAAGGEHDGGTNSRVFSTILTWMQEKNKPVFVVATANNISKLPPELLRKGRFDEIFFVDLPTPLERENIFRIHLRKFGQNSIKNFKEIVNATKAFNGAEIEETVKEAMFLSYVENQDKSQIEERHLLEAASNIVPLVRTMSRHQIEELRSYVTTKRARLASSNANTEDIDFIYKDKTDNESPKMMVLEEDLFNQ